MEKNETMQTQSNISSAGELLRLVAEGILAGAFTGLTISLYRFLLTRAESGLFQILDYIRGNLTGILLWLLILASLGLLVSLLLRLEPMAGGGGIPQVLAEMEGRLGKRQETHWYRIIPVKLAAAVLCIFGGLSLGRGGPSIQLGAMAGKGIACIGRAGSRHKNKERQLTLLSCGAAAGLAATFHAPVAGVLFLLEGLRRTADRALLLTGMAAAVSADITAKLFFGPTTVFSYPASALPLRYYWLLPLLGIFLGLAGAAYNLITLKGQALFKRLSGIPAGVRLSAVFLLSGLLGLFLPQVLGSGQAMTKLLVHNRPSLYMLIVLVVVKILFSAVCVGSGAPGGMFFPLFATGSYLGAVFGGVVIAFLPLPETLWSHFIILGMTGLLTGIMRVPLTGIFLVAEMTGSVIGLLDMAIVSLAACLTANFTGVCSINTSLLENFLAGQASRE